MLSPKLYPPIPPCPHNIYFATSCSNGHFMSGYFVSHSPMPSQGFEVACLDGQTASVAFRNDDAEGVSAIVGRTRTEARERDD
jgi:hypothetical protein